MSKRGEDEILEIAEQCFGDLTCINTNRWNYITFAQMLLGKDEELDQPIAFINEMGELVFYKDTDFDQCEYGGLERLYRRSKKRPLSKYKLLHLAKDLELISTEHRRNTFPFYKLTEKEEALIEFAEMVRKGECDE